MIDLIFEIVVDGIFLGIDAFLNNNKISKFLRRLVVLFIFSIATALIIFLFPIIAEINTTVAYTVVMIGTLVFLYGTIKCMSKIGTSKKEERPIM